VSNEHYLIVSYFLVGLVSLCLGIAVYRVLRTPFAAIAEAATGRLRSRVLTRAFGVFMTLAATLGFLSVSYNQRGCVSYERVIQNRYFLEQNSKEQLQKTADWIVAAIFFWCVVVLICLVALRRAQANRHDNA
jgi:hypothetical protein